MGAQNQYLASCLISGSSKKSVLLYDSSGKGKIIGMGTHQGLGARGQRARLAHMIAYCRHYKIGLGILVELFQILKDDAVKVLHSICQQILKSQQWPQDWKRSVFIPIPKKGNAKECSNYHAIALISHASKVMLKILHIRLQQYVNRELPEVQAGFRKGRGTRVQIANICWIIEKAREFQKNIYFCFIGYAKAFDCVDHNKLWKILQYQTT